MEFEGRKVLIKALVGSQNYNLNTPESDKDYKYFVLPTFDDLYFNRMFSTAEQSKTVDYSVHDIRKLPELWWKANINFLEVLFSNEITINAEGGVKELLSQIFDLKDTIARMNLPYLYEACKGMYFSKIKYLEKGTEKTQYLVEKYGYDTKQALHAYRVLDFCLKFYANDFTDFKDATTYDGDWKKYIISIKNGRYSLESYKDIVAMKYEEFQKVEKYYKEQLVNKDLNNKIIDIIKMIVQMNI